MKNIIKFLIITILSFSINSVFAQADFSMIEEIKKQLNTQEQAELSKAQNLIKLGDDLLEEGENMMTTAKNQQLLAEKSTGNDKKKNEKLAKKTTTEAYVKLFAAAENYKEANRIVYNLYKKNLKILKEEMKDTNKVSQIEELEDEANNYYVQGAAYRKQAEKLEESHKKYKYLVDAEQLETDAISIQIQAYSIHYAWFEPDENEKVEEIVNIVGQTSKENKDSTKITNPNITEDKIIFRIQIAASQSQLSMIKLRQIYPSEELIYTDIDGYWYKYMVGNYKSYEEAYQSKSKIGVMGAFIVAYKNNTRVKNITEVCSPTNHPAND